MTAAAAMKLHSLKLEWSSSVICEIVPKTGKTPVTGGKRPIFVAIMARKTQSQPGRRILFGGSSRFSPTAAPTPWGGDGGGGIPGQSLTTCGGGPAVLQGPGGRGAA